MILIIAAVTPFYVTLFWAINFLSRGISFSPPRFILGVFMLFSAVLFFSHSIYFLGYQETYLFYLDSFYTFTSLSVYPMYYWYVKMLTSETRFILKNLYHFLPALFLSIALVFVHAISEPYQQWDYFYRVLVDNDFTVVFEGGLSGVFARIYFLSRAVFAIQVFYYLLRGYFLAKAYDERLANFYSNLKNRQLVWVKLLSLVFLFTSITSTVLNILGRGYFLKDSELLIIPSLLFSALLFLIGYQGSLQDYTVSHTEVDEFEAESSFFDKNNNNRGDLKRRIVDLMEKEQLFRMPDLRITLLCKKLNTNRTYISVVINEEFGDSFNMFVNRYRVAFAKELMKNEQAASMKYSLDYMASECGFGSASSLIRSFKQIEGAPPGKFMQELNSKRGGN